MFTANIVYLMARCFEKTVVLKPFTSCICTPERFLICQSKAGDSLSTISLLHKVCPLHLSFCISQDYTCQWLLICWLSSMSMLDTYSNIA